LLTALSGQAKAHKMPVPTGWGAEANSPERPAGMQAAERSSQDRRVRPQSPPPPISVPIEPTPRTPRVEYIGPPVIVPGPPPPPTARQPSLNPTPAAPQTGVVWTVPPQPVHPERALDQELSATVELQCIARPDGVVYSCSVISESVVGFGFAAAALRSIPASRVTPQSAGRAIRFRLVFNAPPSLPSGSTVVSAPLTGSSRQALTWYLRPSPIYPEAASNANSSTTVLLSCRANFDGTLSECQVESEGVQSMGFGAAALRSIPASRLTLGSAVRAAGGRVRFQVVFFLR